MMDTWCWVQVGYRVPLARKPRRERRFPWIGRRFGAWIHGMTPNELRSRLDRSGFSAGRLAAALSISRPQVARWVTGARPIPEYHLPVIIRLTENPPPRSAPAWRPAADMRGEATPRRQSRATVDFWSGLSEAVNAVLPKTAPAAPHAVSAPAPAPVDLAASGRGPLHSDFVDQHNAAQQSGARRPLP